MNIAASVMCLECKRNLCFGMDYAKHATKRIVMTKRKQLVSCASSAKRNMCITSLWASAQLATAKPLDQGGRHLHSYDHTH